MGYTLARVYKMQKRISLEYIHPRTHYWMLWASMDCPITQLRSFLRTSHKKLNNLKFRLRCRVYRSCQRWVLSRISFRVHSKLMGWSISAKHSGWIRYISKDLFFQLYMAIICIKLTPSLHSINYCQFSATKIHRLARASSYLNIHSKLKIEYWERSNILNSILSIINSYRLILYWKIH